MEGQVVHDLKRRHFSRTPFVVTLLLLAVYPFSYAPILKMVGPWKSCGPISFGSPSVYFTSATLYLPVDGRDLPAYKPVDWLVDKTPLRGPLLDWAELWGTRDAMIAAGNSRRTGFRP